MYAIAFNDMETMKKVEKILKNISCDDKVVMTGSPYDMVSRLEAEATYDNMQEELITFSEEDQKQFILRLQDDISNDEYSFQQLAERSDEIARRLAEENGLYSYI